MRWLVEGGNGGYEILVLWAIVNLIFTWILLGIYDKLTGDNSLSVDSDIEKKITSLQDKIPKREICNRSSNGGRSPWVLVWVLGPAAGGILMIFLPESPVLAAIIGFTLVFAIGHVVTNTGRHSRNFTKEIVPKGIKPKSGRIKVGVPIPTDQNSISYSDFDMGNKEEIAFRFGVLYDDVKDDTTFDSFISYRKNATGQFKELLERHYLGRSRESLEKALKGRYEFLYTTPLGNSPIYKVDQFLEKCDEFSKEKHYWKKDVVAVFDQITNYASVILALSKNFEDRNVAKFILFQLAILTFALKAHNDPRFRKRMKIEG